MEKTAAPLCVCSSTFSEFHFFFFFFFFCITAYLSVIYFSVILQFSVVGKNFGQLSVVKNK